MDRSARPAELTAHWSSCRCRPAASPWAACSFIRNSFTAPVHFSMTSESAWIEHNNRGGYYSVTFNPLHLKIYCHPEKKKNATSQNFDSIIFIYFISFFESPNLENKSLKWQLSNNSTSLQTLWDELFLFKGKRYLGLRFKLREKNCILVIINWKKNLLLSTDLEQLFSKASYWGWSIYTAS